MKRRLSVEPIKCLGQVRKQAWAILSQVQHHSEELKENAIPHLAFLFLRNQLAHLR